jgi:aspartate/methionine/tyrosine aminotransferase
MSINRIEQTRQKLLSKGKKIINLSSGNPNEWGIFFKNKIVNSTIQKFLSSSPAYSPLPFGNYGTRLALQNHAPSPGPRAPRAYFSAELRKPKKTQQTKAENIALTSGTSESYFHLFRILSEINNQTQNTNPLQNTGEILLPRPGYPLFEEIARLSRTNLKWYDIYEKNGWQINEENITKNLTSKTKAIVLVTPNNPTGTVLNKKSLQTVIKIAEENKLSIISDEVFSEYYFQKGKFPHVASLKTSAPIFTLNGISKTYALPGYKLGWIIMNKNVSEQIKEELERSLDALLSSNQISQELLPTILKNGASFIKKTTQRLEQNRKIMNEVFAHQKDIKYTPCEGGFYTFIQIKNLPIDDETFTIQLMEENRIYVHPGYFYDYDQDPTPKNNHHGNNQKNIYIVISLLPPPSNFKKYLTQIKNFIQEVRMS